MILNKILFKKVILADKINYNELIKPLTTTLRSLWDKLHAYRSKTNPPHVK